MLIPLFFPFDLGINDLDLGPRSFKLNVAIGLVHNHTFIKY